MSDSTTFEQKFFLYHIGLFLNEKDYTLRFPVPAGWTVDMVATKEMECGGILTPAGKAFNNTDVFISINLNFNPNNLGFREEDILKDLENYFEEDGGIKDSYLSSIKTYDERIVSVITMEDKQLEYVRKNLLIPLREELSIVLRIALQVNNLDVRDADVWFAAMEALIRGCKCTETEEDLLENDLYALDLVEKNFEQYYAKI